MICASSSSLSRYIMFDTSQFDARLLGLQVPLIAGYTLASKWSDLERTALSSYAGSTVDELIQLQDTANANHNQRPFGHIRRIVYRSIEEIPTLLKSTTCLRPKIGISANTAPFTPAWRHNDAEGDVRGESGSKEEQQNVAEESDDMVQEEPTTVDVAEIGGGQAAVTVIVPTEVDVNAARTIQAIYRRHLSMRRGAAKNPTEDLRRRIVVACQAKCAQLQWPHRHYKMLFLGPLPHLLICLESMHSYIFAAKDQAKKRLLKVGHRELEEAQATLSTMSRTLQDIVRLQKALGLESDLHVTRDLLELKARTLEVGDLIHRLPSGATLGWQEDWRLAHRGIVKEVPAHTDVAELLGRLLQISLRQHGTVCYACIAPVRRLRV